MRKRRHRHILLAGIVLLLTALACTAWGQQLPGWVMRSDHPVHTSAELDEAIDHSAHLPQVGNRGQQHSTTAWSIAYYLKTYQEWRERGWDITPSSRRFSPAFVYNLTNHGTDQGCDLIDAMQVLYHHGCATLADMPYDDEDHTTWPSRPDWIAAMEYRTGPWSFIQLDSTGLEQLKSLLLDDQLALVEIKVYPNFTNVDDYDNTYCLSEISGNQQGSVVLPVVGFSDDFETVDGDGAFKVVNCVGAGWGLSGYCWISYEAMASAVTCGGFAFHTEDRINYQPELTLELELTHDDRYGLSFPIGLGVPDDPVWSRTFFSWQDEDEYNLHSMPPTSIVFDLTDAAWMLNANSFNTLFAGVTDNHPGNGGNGQLDTATVYYTTWSDTATSPDPPVFLPDADTTVTVTIPMTGPGALPAPLALTASLNQQNGIVYLEWEHPDQGGPTEELAYDDGYPDGYYDYQGYTLGVWMSPTDSCRVLSLSYYLQTLNAYDPFQVRIYDWNEVTGQPSSTLLYSRTVEATADGWHTVEINDATVRLSGGFVAGFGSLNTTVRLGYDEANNERSFDFNGSEWEAWPQTYFIRALVQLEDGSLQTIGMDGDAELDEFVSYRVYRNANVIAEPMDNTAVDQLFQYSTYQYWVTALYDNGESEPSNIVEVDWELAVPPLESGLPTEFAITKPHPNPFNSSTRFDVRLPRDGDLRVEVVNILGQTVGVVESGRFSAGSHAFTLDARTYATGVYFLKATLNGNDAPLRKLVLVR